MKKRCICVLFLTWSLAPLLRIQAQESPLIDISPRIDFLTTADGLPTTYVTSVLQDDFGFLWIGTSTGIASYDGHLINVYPIEEGEADEFRSAHVNELYSDLSGELWVSTTQGGFYRFDRTTDRFIPYDPGFRASDTIIETIYEASSNPGMLWLGTRGEGLVRLDVAEGNVLFYRHDNLDPYSLSSDSVYAVYEDLAGNFWVGTEAGLDRFDEQTGVFIHVSPGADPVADRSPGSNDRSSAIRMIYESPAAPGSLWVSRSDGLLRFDPQTGEFGQTLYIPPTEGQSSGVIGSMQEGSKGVLYAWSHRELFRYDRAAGQFDRISVQSASILDLYVDRSGILWIATRGSGLGKMDPESRRFSQLQLGPELARKIQSQRPIYNFFEDRDGDFWLAFGMGQLARVDRKTDRITYFQHDPDDPGSLGSGYVTDMYEDRTGTLWVSVCGSGLDRFDRKTGAFLHYRIDIGDVGFACPNVLLEDRDGDLWVGAWGGGLYRMDRKTGRFTRYVHDPDDPQSLGDNRVLSLFEDRRGRLWIGTATGVSSFDPESEPARSASDQTKNRSFVNYRLSGWGMVTAIREDRFGRLWAGTGGKGLYWIDTETGSHSVFTAAEGLAHDIVWDVQIDNLGRLWIATSNGISRLDTETLAFHNYDIVDGLPHNVFLERSGFKSKSGALYFITVNGEIAVFDPEQIREDPMPPPIVFTDFQLLDKTVSPVAGSPLSVPVSVAREIQLTHQQRDFTLNFAALSYRHIEKQQYAYRLEGYDRAWREVGAQRSATYTNLAPGTYTFRVKASNGDGIWNEEGASLRITISPPWWRTPWAYTLYAFAFVSLIWGGYRWRIHRLSRYAFELRQMVLERTRELEAEKKKTEDQAQKLLELGQSKDRFFANISHEFRTPLTLILGSLHDILDGIHGSVDQKVRRQLGIAQRNATRLLHLITELLYLTRLDVGKLPLRRSHSDLVVLLRDIVLSFASQAERCEVNLQFKNEVDELAFYFDAEKVEKIAVNLLSNAFNHSQKGGKIRVRLREVVNAAGVFAVFTVKDTGCGIPAEALKHVFDRFYRVETSTTRAEEGTGIGLALAKSLVELHGGDIDVESEEGFGSVFTVRMPVVNKPLQHEDLFPVDGNRTNGEARMAIAERIDIDDEHASAKTMAIEDLDIPDRHHRSTILLVEDNADVRDYLKGHLAHEYGIIEAEDGITGLEKTFELVPDLVIADVMMPQMDGVALCNAIKEDERTSHIPVILLTAKASEEAELEGLEAGADDYVTKPFSVESLLARVENVIEVRRMLRRRFSEEFVVKPGEVVIPTREAIFLKHVRDVVEKHMGESYFSVEWLAHEVGLSSRQLQRRLKNLVKLSPAGFVRMMRMERAEKLLASHAGTVSEVAYMVGIQDAGYFARMFRQTFGVSPSEYAINQTKTPTDQT